MKRTSKPISDELRRVMLRRSMIRAIGEFHFYSAAPTRSMASKSNAALAYVAGFEAASCLNLLGGFLAAW